MVKGHGVHGAEGLEVWGVAGREVVDVTSSAWDPVGRVHIAWIHGVGMMWHASSLCSCFLGGGGGDASMEPLRHHQGWYGHMPPASRKAGG